MTHRPVVKCNHACEPRILFSFVINSLGNITCYPLSFPYPINITSTAANNITTTTTAAIAAVVVAAAVLVTLVSSSEKRCILCNYSLALRQIYQLLQLNIAMEKENEWGDVTHQGYTYMRAVIFLICNHI